MNNCSMEIWGRKFDINVVFDCYEGEEILESQQTAYQLFIEKAPELLDGVRIKVEEYCLKNNGEDIGADTITNIFKYVKPKTLFIKRRENGERKVALLCNYKFRPDDGIAIIFSDEQFIAVETEDHIL